MPDKDNSEKSEFLKKRGWFTTGGGGWAWQHPQYKSAWYRLPDAYDLAVYEEKEARKGKK